MVKSIPNKIKKQRLVKRAYQLKDAAKQKKKQTHEHLHLKSKSQIKARMNQAASLMKNIYRPELRTLLVGEGNFSFSRALIRNWENEELSLKKAAHKQSSYQKNSVDDLPGFNMVATCYDKKEELYSKYQDVKDIVQEIKGKGGTVFCGIDGTKLLDSKRLLRALSEFPQSQELEQGIDDHFGFDRIVFNFPHLGCSIKDTEANNEQHRMMLHKFFLSAYSVLATDGLVMVTIKIGDPYDGWKVPSIALDTGLFQVRSSIPFSPKDFPGYEHRRTLGAPTNELEANLDIDSFKTSARTLVFIKAKNVNDTETSDSE